MDGASSNKRLKLSNGTGIKKSAGNSAAANLPAYRPPAAIGARGGTSPTSPRPSASIARPANGKTSLRLTVKAAPSKLRQATSGSQVSPPIPPNPYTDNASESDATPIPVARTARSTRNPRTVVEPESDEEEEEAEEEEEDEEPEEPEEVEEEEELEDEDEIQVAAEEEDEELEDAEDSEEDAEGEEDEDEDMEDADDHPPPPIIKTSHPLSRSKPNVTVTAPPEGPMQSVEDKEMEDDEEEELSELDSNEEEDEEDSDSDEDDESRGATPDLSKLTRRQRGIYEEADAGLMALSNEAQKKKHLTAEEHAMRRAEMARRRKNLSEKRNEEEKMDTINKLLKKPAPKRRTRAEIIAAQQAEYMATPGAEDGEEERADPLFVRWIHTKQGSRLAVPDEWMDLEGGIGDVFRTGWNGGGRMVEEVA